MTSQGTEKIVISIHPANHIVGLKLETYTTDFKINIHSSWHFHVLTQRLSPFPWERHFTIIAHYYLVPGTYFSMIYTSRTKLCLINCMSKACV